MSLSYAFRIMAYQKINQNDREILLKILQNYFKSYKKWHRTSELCKFVKYRKLIPNNHKYLQKPPISNHRFKYCKFPFIFQPINLAIANIATFKTQIMKNRSIASFKELTYINISNYKTHIKNLETINVLIIVHFRVRF